MIEILEATRNDMAPSNNDKKRDALVGQRAAHSDEMGRDGALAGRSLRFTPCSLLRRAPFMLRGLASGYRWRTKSSWERFEVIADRRVRTELEPTVHFLKGLQQAHGAKVPPHLNSRADFLEGGVSFYHKARKLPRSIAKRLMKLDARIAQLLSGGKTGTV